MSLLSQERFSLVQFLPLGQVVTARLGRWLLRTLFLPVLSGKRGYYRLSPRQD